MGTESFTQSSGALAGTCCLLGGAGGFFPGGVAFFFCAHALLTDLRKTLLVGVMFGLGGGVGGLSFGALTSDSGCFCGELFHLCPAVRFLIVGPLVPGACHGGGFGEFGTALALLLGCGGVGGELPLDTLHLSPRRLGDLGSLLKCFAGLFEGCGALGQRLLVGLHALCCPVDFGVVTGHICVLLPGFCAFGSHGGGGVCAGEQLVQVRKLLGVSRLGSA